MNNAIERIEEKLVEAIKKAVCELPEDVVEALKKAYEREESEIAKIQLDAILKNIEVAKKEALPMCQDTGTQTFFVEIGADFKCAPGDMKLLKDTIAKAVRRATAEVPLRPNAVDPFTKKNSRDNTGRFIPSITWDFVDGSDITITALPKGGGSENQSALGMIKPTEGLEGAKKFVIDRILEAGGEPCPPTIIGVCIGGGADLSMKLAKKALLRRTGERHPDPKIADLERELIEKINSSGIGPMGLGGKTTVLDVHVEYASRHPASFPVGVVVQCWAHRKAKVIIHSDDTVEVV